MLHFVGDGDQKKFTKNPRLFSMQNSQANSKKKSTKIFWRAVKVRFQRNLRSPVAKKKGLGYNTPNVLQTLGLAALFPTISPSPEGCQKA